MPILGRSLLYVHGIRLVQAIHGGQYGYSLLIEVERCPPDGVIAVIETQTGQVIPNGLRL